MTDAKEDPNPEDWLILKVCQWILDFYDHVREAMRSRGGWEVWAQLELLFVFQRLVGDADYVEREVFWISPEATLADKMDFWFTWHKQDPEGVSYRHWGVTLKCRRALGSHEDFVNEMMEDFGRADRTPYERHTPAAMYSIGIFTDAADLKGYGELGGNEVYYVALTHPKDQHNPIYVIWRKVVHG